MKTWMLRSLGYDGLSLEESPDPEPGPGQVLLRMLSASLNSRDLQVVTGIYPGSKLPIVPVSDGVGEVIAVGEGVTRVAVGDRVSPHLFRTWLRGPMKTSDWGSALAVGGNDGVLREFAVFDAEHVVKVPAHLTDDEASTLTIAGLTAWQSLFVADSVKSGDTILVQGTGGVSIFALQLAVAAGARVIVTSSSDAKLERAKALGAWATINYRTTPEWQEEARKLTGGEGVHHVVEVVGDHKRSIRALRLGGALSVVGYLQNLDLSGSSRVGAQETDVLGLILSNGRVYGIACGNRDSYEDMNRAIGIAGFHPVVDRTFGFDEAVDAMRYLESGSHFGKVCIRIGD
jgi:NADPH:quinone reductase-like Zn-dependent oxidoreductase